MDVSITFCDVLVTSNSATPWDEHKQTITLLKSLSLLHCPLSLYQQILKAVNNRDAYQKVND